MKQWSILLVFLSLSLSLSAQQGYEKDVFVSSTGDSLPYRMIRPESMKAGKKYPLVLFLHGAGERGNDNERQLTHGGQMFLNPVNREKYPAFVLVPQCPAGSYWAYTERPKSLFPADMPAGQEMSSLTRTLKQLLDTYLAMPEVDKNGYILSDCRWERWGRMIWWSVIRRFCGCRSHLRIGESGPFAGCQRSEVPYISWGCR